MAVTLGGCSGNAEPQPDPPPDLQDRLDTARQVLDDAESIEFTMSTDDLPSGVNGLLEAQGVGTHDPAFEGEVRVATTVGSLSADVVSVDGNVRAKIGFSPIYVPLDPGSYGAPDPAQLLDVESGVSSFLTATDNIEGGDQARAGDEVLTTISGTLPGSAVAAVIPSADDTGDFGVVYGLTDDDELRTAVLTGPFYPDADEVTYSLTLDPSAETVEITAP
ncbi:MAG: LppX_LprAFG lipoprotein [Nocardioidaceae bacterium]|nr:LppX_LprAFG lipoprotein [Nocardioidaceae bacterium]